MFYCYKYHHYEESMCAKKREIQGVFQHIEKVKIKRRFCFVRCMAGLFYDIESLIVSVVFIYFWVFINLLTFL